MNEYGDALPPGTRIAEFEIVRELGPGGFGITYLARDRALERMVAVKESAQLLLPPPQPGRSQVALGDGDRRALEALYNATGGDKWRVATNWLTDASLRRWWGGQGRF